MNSFVYVVYSVSRRRHVLARYYKNDLLVPCSDVYKTAEHARQAAEKQDLQVMASGDFWDISADLKEWRATR